MSPFPSPWSAASRGNAYICASFHIQNSTIMAKGNMFLGMSRGSVGDVTFYRSRGNQVARARNRQPANPKTEAQVIQRMILATASKAYSRMKGIVDHSFQGIQYGGASQTYFLKRAMDDIRAWVAKTITITGEYPADLRDPLMYRGLSFPLDAHESGVGLLISEGSLPSIEPHSRVIEGESHVVSFGNIVPENPKISDVMTAFGAQRGDQITIVGLRDVTKVFAYSRYVIKADATDAELAVVWDPTGAAAAFDQVKTQVGDLQIVHVEGAGMFPTEDLCIAAGIILSRKVGDVWQRSSQRLVWLLDAGDYTTTDVVAAEWMAGTAQIDTVNPRYLNQAEQSL